MPSQKFIDNCTKSLKLLYGGSDAFDESKKLLTQFIEKWQTSQNPQTSNANANANVNATATTPDARSVGTQYIPQCVLITYGDSIIADGEATKHERTLVTLERFLKEYANDSVEGLHILPFFPYTSDDGFSISDYTSVREDLGTWEDIHILADSFALMADLVLNHCSQRHDWFKKFLQNKAPYDDYFVTADPQADLSRVVRPRPHPLLSEFEVTIDTHQERREREGSLATPPKSFTKYVWTTFSRDQVDLNYANPKVLFEYLHYFLLYMITNRISLVRLDAVAYVWKELGTPCIHHPKTYEIVGLMRTLLDEFAPDCVLITETNVPHKENMSYLGDGDLAHMVYQFSLPPLLVHTFLKGNAQSLLNWITSLDKLPNGTSYFNFCASHDGIGITPSYGILSDDERKELLDHIVAVGGKISYKATPQGEIPYEMNCNFLSAIAPAFLNENASALSVDERAKKFLASQAIALVLPGVFGLYIHSFLGSENWTDGVKLTGHNRSINRQQLEYDALCKDLRKAGTLRNLVWEGMRTMLRARLLCPALDIESAYGLVDYTWSTSENENEDEDEDSGDANSIPLDQGTQSRRPLFVLERWQDGAKKVLCIINVTGKAVDAYFDASLLAWNEGVRNLLEDELLFVHSEERIVLRVEAYQVLLLESEVEL